MYMYTVEQQMSEYRRIIMLITIVLFTVVGHAYGQYVGNEYPYSRGPLDVDYETFVPFTPINPIPMYTRVWFPTRLDSYPMWYFIGGFAGTFPSGAYSDIITKIVSHGFIVVGTWPLIGDEGVDLSTEAHVRNIEWLKENLEDRIPVKPSWDHMTFGCHSAGCGRTFELAEMDNKLAQATVHIEPVSSAVRDGVNFTQPAIILGAELAGTCGGGPMSDFDYYYSQWTCPKIKLEVEAVGHCDCLDDPAWNACRMLNICEMGDKSQLQRYRDLIQGMTTAFMRTFVMDDEDSLKWITEPSLMPMDLVQHEYELDCSKA